MNNKKSDNNSYAIKVGVFANSRRLGQILSHEGVIQVISALQEKPKQYREMDAELRLPSSTFERALKDLYKKVHLIRKIPIVAKNRETHQYVLNPIGKELIKSLINYEKFMIMPSSQQTVIELESK